MRIRAIVILASVVSAASVLPAQSIDPSKWIKTDMKSDPKSSLNNDDIASGLKEALKIGSDNTVSLTGKTNGYFGNEAIRIPMPEKLSSLEKALRAAGQGEKLDAFVLSMNRAAEKAAPAAKDILWNAIQNMSFEDARKILSGNDTAATDYFRAKTGEELGAAFRPPVTQTMNEVGVTTQYKDLVGRYESIPFARSVSFDIDGYVVSKALDGLFHVLGEEERKIRKDPAARVTDLLKTVFGR